MKCQVLFSRKNKKNIIKLSFAEFTHSMERVTNLPLINRKKKYFEFTSISSNFSGDCQKIAKLLVFLNGISSVVL